MVQVNNDTPLWVRLRFRKVGRLRYISHLDLVRTFMKVVIRAQLPLWYSEGFNPKPRLVFSAPLSVGAESETEFLDIRLSSPMDPAEVMERINRNVTDECRMLEAYVPATRLSELMWLAYDIRIHTNGADAEMAQRAQDILTGGTLIVEKKTKTGIAPTDIRPKIREATVTAADGTLLVRAVLSADSAAFLNPDYLIRALKERMGILSDPDLTREYVTILRTAAYRADGKEFR